MSRRRKKNSYRNKPTDPLFNVDIPAEGFFGSVEVVVSRDIHQTIKNFNAVYEEKRLTQIEQAQKYHRTQPHPNQHLLVNPPARMIRTIDIAFSGLWAHLINPAARYGVSDAYNAFKEILFWHIAQHNAPSVGTDTKFPTDAYHRLTTGAETPGFQVKQNDLPPFPFLEALVTLKLVFDHCSAEKTLTSAAAGFLSVLHSEVNPDGDPGCAIDQAGFHPLSECKAKTPEQSRYHTHITFAET